MSEQLLKNFISRLQGRPLSDEYMTVVFDLKLNYRFANAAACVYLQRSNDELIGNSLVDVFPEMIASKSHRNILKAITGETIDNQLIEEQDGNYFRSTFAPIIEENSIIGVLVLMKKVDRYRR